MRDDKEKGPLDHYESENEKEKDAPLIKQGFDYIWGSDQDDLVEYKEE